MVRQTEKRSVWQMVHRWEMPWDAQMAQPTVRQMVRPKVQRLASLSGMQLATRSVLLSAHLWDLRSVKPMEMR